MVSMDYGHILKNSWKVTLKNKWLWVYGLTLAAFEGGGSLNIPSLPSGSGDKLKNLPETSREVLGASTSFLSDWFSRVPVSTWILLGIGVFALILFGLVISLVIRSWAKGSLIAGVSQALEDKPTDLITTSPSGISSLKSLVIFSSLSLGITLGVVLISVILVVLLFILNPILGAIFSLLIGLGVLIAFAVMTTIGVYAERLIVFKQYSPWLAWKTGLALGWKNFWHTISMGLINNLLGCTGGCLANLLLVLVLGIPAFFLALPLFKSPPEIPGIISWVTLAVLFLLFITANLLIRAFFTVFSYSNWHQFYQSITSTHD